METLSFVVGAYAIRLAYFALCLTWLGFVLYNEQVSDWWGLISLLCLGSLARLKTPTDEDEASTETPTEPKPSKASPITICNN